MYNNQSELIKQRIRTEQIAALVPVVKRKQLPYPVSRQYAERHAFRKYYWKA